MRLLWKLASKKARKPAISPFDVSTIVYADTRLTDQSESQHAYNQSTNRSTNHSTRTLCNFLLLRCVCMSFKLLFFFFFLVPPPPHPVVDVFNCLFFSLLACLFVFSLSSLSLFFFFLLFLIFSSLFYLFVLWNYASLQFNNLTHRKSGLKKDQKIK